MFLQTCINLKLKAAKKNNIFVKRNSVVFIHAAVCTIIITSVLTSLVIPVVSPYSLNTLELWRGEASSSHLFFSLNLEVKILSKM